MSEAVELTEQQIDERLEELKDVEIGFGAEPIVEEVEPDLMPSEAEDIPEPDFGEPLKPFEIDNLRYALSESVEGAMLMRKIETEGITEEALVQAKELGVSQRQIDGYLAHTIQEAKKMFSEADMSYSQGAKLMDTVRKNFSDREMGIFKSELNQDPVKALKSVKDYLIKEGMYV